MEKRKEKPKKVSKSQENKNEKTEDENVLKQVGTFNDFVILDKKDETGENELNLINNASLVQHNPDNTKSRFSNLFQEILENDKKLEQKKNNNIGINIINDITEDEKLLPNNLIEDNDNNEDKNKNFDENEILNINEEMKNLIIDENNNINLESKYIDNLNNLNNINIINNDNDNINLFNNSINNEQNKNINKINFKNNPNNNILNNNFPNINNNINNNMNNNILFNYNPNINNINNNQIHSYLYNYQEKKGSDAIKSNTSSGFPSSASTEPSSMGRNSSAFSIVSNSSGAFFGPVGDPNKNYELFNFSNKNSIYEPPSRPSEKKFDLNIDIKRILYLDDRRTTLMIKNIPNKFKRDLLIKIIDQNFKGAYDLYILPTDANGYKNFGYSFINFTCSYYIPYFYFLFHNKKWSSTNSKKVCEITYSKIQGRNSLLSHYSSKIIYKNSEAKKPDSNNKYLIPNEYYNIFNSAYPNYTVEKFESYFITKMPFRY
jgi:hypothetical protein